MPQQRDEAWYDDFWSNIQADEDDGISAVRLIGELFDAGIIVRAGDYIAPANHQYQEPMLRLDAGDQFLIRRIQEAGSRA